MESLTDLHHQQNQRSGRPKPIHSDFQEMDAGVEILLVDAGSDESVRSYILERLPKLVSAGHRTVLGLRDYYTGNPKRTIDLVRSEEQDKLLSKAHNISVKVHYAIEEIEAWFFLDPELFSKIDSRLTAAIINSRLGKDTTTICVDSLSHPAGLVNAIFEIIGDRYRKKEDQSYRICNLIDYVKIYLQQSRSPSFSSFITSLEKGLKM